MYSNVYNYAPFTNNDQTQKKTEDNIPTNHSNIPPNNPPNSPPNNQAGNTRYRNVFEGCSFATSMLQQRLDRLKYQRELIKSSNTAGSAYYRDMGNMYNMRNLSAARGMMGNPNLYSYQFIDPIYYPLEMPSGGEPISMPRIEMGAPVENPDTGNKGLGINDILTLLNALGRTGIQQNLQPQPQPQPPVVKVEEEKKPKTPSKATSKKSNKPRKVPVIPDSNKNKEDPGRLVKRDWWKLASDFVNLYIFFSTANKYTKFSTTRTNMIMQRTKAIVQDIALLKDWVIAIEEPFWNEFKVFQDLNVAFKNIDSKIKIQKESQKIIAMIKKYMENLIAKSSKLKDIPERIQGILYEYIKENAYYPRKYLSTFQVNRIDFNFYGGSRNLTEPQMGMIIAYLIISGVTVQQILLHMKDIFVEFKNYPNIDISAKYIGSIIHYLTRDTFQNDPTMLKEILALMNYYRNYHLYNEQAEKQQDIFNSNMVFIDDDEFAEFLIPEGTISEFWNLNAAFNETYKNFIYAWACKLAKLIKMKFSKKDPARLEKPKKIERPKDKTVEYDVKIGNQM